MANLHAAAETAHGPGRQFHSGKGNGARLTALAGAVPNHDISWVQASQSRIELSNQVLSVDKNPVPMQCMHNVSAPPLARVKSCWDQNGACMRR